MNSLNFCFLIWGIMGPTLALDDFSQFAGPACSSIPIASADADRAAIDRLRYVVAGHRYALYRMASLIAKNYVTMTENELLDTICFSRNASTTAITQPSGAFLFGKFIPLKMSTRPSVYFSAPFGPNGIIYDAVVTLTDEITFAVVINCWKGPGVDASSFLVLGQTPRLPGAVTWRRITSHLSNLGFRKEDMLISKTGNCNWRENLALND